MTTLGLSFFIVAWFNLFTVTENRVVGKFDSVSVDGPIQAFLVRNLGDTVRVVADDNLPRLISTTVEDGKLVIAPTQAIRHERVLKVYVSMETLRSIEVNGAATLDFTEKMNVDSLQVKLGGGAEARILAECKDMRVYMNDASNIFLAGKTTNLYIKLMGVSDIVAYNMISNNCLLEIDTPPQSPGIFRVTAMDTLRVNMKKISSRLVQVKGNPVLIRTGTGTGEVKMK